MSKKTFFNDVKDKLNQLNDKGVYKKEQIIQSPQGVEVFLKENNQKIINLCSNNYLGLCNNTQIKQAAHDAIEKYGFGLSSVRFLSGTLDIHKILEDKIKNFLSTEDSILYSSCFDANTGFFESLFSEEDAIISDRLNHASIIDGMRLCKAKKFIFESNNMESLEEKLKQASNCKNRIIVTDGVFSMDGVIAKLDEIHFLANKYDAFLMVDDSHATGVIGDKGKGSSEYHSLLGKIDVITSTLGKALGGASGGFVAAKKEMIDWLRQTSRPYLFSNSLSPIVAYTSIAAFDILEKNDSIRKKLKDNTAYFRKKMTEKGFDIIKGIHPIVPVMIYDEAKAFEFAKKLLQENVFVIGLAFPVVPKNMARIRVQISADHNINQLEQSISAFEKIAKQIGVL